MHPICFHIGARPIYWYGVMIAAAFLACIAHWTILGRREGLSPSFGPDIGLWLMLAGVAGARAGYVIANFSDFAADPLNILRLDKGGLVFYGGFIAACGAVIIFARLKHEKLWALADFIITALPLGHAIGRIGCFLNGCCHGQPAILPWSIEMHGALRHPAQLYSAILNLAVYTILLKVYIRGIRAGRVFALYLMLYPTGRFLIEFLRGDERLSIFGLSGAQYICILLFAAGIALWFFPLEKQKTQ